MSSPLYMLDTNMASYIIREANPHLRAQLKKIPSEAICLSSITQAELLYGLSLKPEAIQLKKAVEGLLHWHEILSWDCDAANQYGPLRAELKRAGQPLSILDTMIAAHALSCGTVLVTNDNAFSRVPGLSIEDWIA